MIILIKQLKPKGIPVEKSSNKPEIKPVVSPKNLPFNKEKYIEQIKIKSGTTIKKEKFDNIEDSITSTHNKIKVLIKVDFIIIFPPKKDFSYHSILFDLQ